MHFGPLFAFLCTLGLFLHDLHFDTSHTQLRCQKQDEWDLGRTLASRKCASLGQCSLLSWEKLQSLKDANVIDNISCGNMTSMDCERAFSTFKDLLSSKRNCLMEAHLKDQMLIQWNQVLL